MVPPGSPTRKKLLAFALLGAGFALGEWLWLRPVIAPTLRGATVYGLMLATNLFYLYNFLFHIALRPRWVRAAYIAWYAVLFGLFAAVAHVHRLHFGGTHRLLLFALFLMLTSGLFHMPRAFGFMVVLLVAYLVFPFFAEATLVLLTIFYLIVLAELRLAREARSYLVLTCFVLGFVLILAVLFPVVNLGASRAPQDLRTALLGSDAFAEGTREALWTSLRTATVTTLVVLALGVPLAYFLVRSEFPGRRVLDALVDLPIVLPPPVAGIAIAQLVSPNMPLGLWLRTRLGLTLVNDWKGIVLAQAFVSCPFLIRSAMAAFQGVDPRLENVSRTLGAGPFATFFRVSLPLAWRGIFMGCILTWGRAISEFASVSVVAEHPETMPVRIYKEFITSGEKGQHATLSILMIVLCVVVFAALHLLASMTIWQNVRTIWSRSGDSGGRPQ